MTPTLRTTVRVATLVAALAASVALPGLAAAQSPAASAAPAASAVMDGTWTIDHSIGSFDYDAADFSGSWVGYRAQEELVGIGGTEAVGRTPDVDGSITLAGTQITAADLTADLTTLRSDQSMRDGQLSMQGVQTAQFPTATFVLTQPIELGSIPAEGTPISVEASTLPPTRRRARGSAALAMSEFEGRDRKALDLGCIEDHQRRFGLWSPEGM